MEGREEGGEGRRGIRRPCAAGPGRPLCRRAGPIRRDSENRWSGENVTLANIAFAEPQFSGLGAVVDPSNPGCLLISGDNLVAWLARPNSPL